MGVPHCLHGISIVFLSLRNSLQFSQRRSGGLMARLRFFFFLLEGATAASGSTPAATAAAAATRSTVDVTNRSSPSFSSGLTPAASWAAFVHVHVPVQLSVLQGSCLSSRSTMSFEQFSQYCG